MFAGIVVEVGSVLRVDEGGLEVRASTALARTRVGSSIAVNGVCLTATEVHPDRFTADVMPETLRRTALAGLRAGAPVNLEPALAFGDEVGGHLVQGHVDAVGTVRAVRAEGNATWVEIDVPAELLRYCVEKGSLAVDGTSLTIAAVDGSSVAVSLIPHTLASTIASGYAPGTAVNLEVDILAKYVARYLADHPTNTEAG
ncbi:MAG: riboflavin synthase [Chloroflexota bacterium]|jgi:riboflavin synthase|nr:riboflavin synthase [Chloroflexota bacterium]